MIKLAIKSTDIKEVTSYFCEKHQRNHNKGSKVFDTCFPDYIENISAKVSRRTSDEAYQYLSTLPLLNTDGDIQPTPKKWDDPSISNNWSSGGEHVLEDVEKALKKTREIGRDNEIKVKMPQETYDRLMHERVSMEMKVPNYRATRWEWPDGHTAFFSPVEMIWFAKHIAIAQGKKWHWWNEKKRKKECKKMGVDPVFRFSATAPT